MSIIDEDIQEVQALAAKICEKHKISFIGFFQNSDKSFERMITESIECTTPNGSFDNNNFSFNNISNNSDVQNVLANLLNTSYQLANASKNTITSSPKQLANSSMNTSFNNSYSLASSSINSADSNSNKNYKLVTIKSQNKVDVKNYLYNCFEEFQQIPCKLLAKSWIKIIEPKKQSKYPYKLGESSKPFWWPPNCIHREPDHLKKDERISLLINILRIFKQKETQLIYAASLIDGLGQQTAASNKKDEFGQRKMSLLKDMFKIVNTQSNLNIETIKVIKPGKKYSSQFYQRNASITNDNSNNNSNEHSATKSTISKSLNTSDNQNTLPLPNLLVTPPTMKNSERIKAAKLITNLNHQHGTNTSEYFYNEFMEYIQHKPDIDNKNKNLNQNQNGPTLSSPFIPSSLHNIPQLRTPPKPHSGTALSLNDNNIETHFFSDNSPPPSTVLKQLSQFTPKKPNSTNPTFKIFNYQVSPPPTGIFTTQKSNFKNQNSKQILHTLNPSKINSLNYQLQNVINNDDKHRIMSKITKPNKHSISSIKKLQSQIDENEETDCEMD